MKQIKPTIADYVNAIIDRDRNSLQFSEVLEEYRITPNQFFKAVFVPTNFFGIARLSDLVTNDEEGTKNILESIDSDYARKTELFRMEEKFIQRQYDRMFRRIKGESQEQLYQGTLIHPENRIILVSYAITSNNPELKSKLENKDRFGIIYEILHLPQHLRVYFQNIGLGGLMNGRLENGKKNSSLGVLELFDSVYQAKTGDDSLFDLTQEYHLHIWNVTFRAHRYYWKKTGNVEQAVYHTLTENHPELASNDRKEVVTKILSFPDQLEAHFSDLKLSGMMRTALHRSPRAVLEVFNNVYVAKTGDASLFDKEKGYYIEFDKHNRLIKQNF